MSNQHPATPTLNFYGVAVDPNTPLVDGDELPLVFTDSKEAVACIKRYKGNARFKVFTSKRDAERFSKQVFDVPSPFTLSGNVPGNAEKPSLYKAPRSQEIVIVRKAIEAGNLEKVCEAVESNPRFLVGSGDTPTVMQEGFRYHALHVACRANKPEILAYLLRTLQDDTLMARLYPDDSPESRDLRVRYCFDMYLNTPDKGRGADTALHFACKFGASECVRLLLECPGCDVTITNGEGKMAAEVICARKSNAPIELIKEIKSYFENCFYVPLLRAEDNSLPPMVGEPFSPNTVHSPSFSPSTTSSSKSVYSAITSPLQLKSPLTADNNVAGTAFPFSPNPLKMAPAQGSASVFQFSPRLRRVADREEFFPSNSPNRRHSITRDEQLLSSPQGLRNSPISDSGRVISAVMGPMSPQQAQEVVCQWKGRRSSVHNRLPCLTDIEKGMEQIGRRIAEEKRVGWREYWSFLSDWCNIRSRDGIEKLERHLRAVNDTINRRRNLSEESSLDVLDLSTQSVRDCNNSALSYASPTYELRQLMTKLTLESPTQRKRSSDVLNISEEIPPSSVVSGSSGEENTASGGQCLTPERVSILIELISERLSAFFGRFFSRFSDLKEKFRYDLDTWTKNQLSLDHRLNSYLTEIHKACFISEEKMKIVREIHTAVALKLCSFLKEFSSDDQLHQAKQSFSSLVTLEPFIHPRAMQLECIFSNTRRLLDDHSISCSCSILPTRHIDINLDEEDKESYFSAESSPNADMSDEFGTPEEAHVCYLQGLYPSKVDADVYKALKGVDVDPMLFPHVVAWLQNMAIADRDDSMQSWPSPSSSRFRAVFDPEENGFSVERSVLGTPPKIRNGIPERRKLFTQNDDSFDDDDNLCNV